ncbi:MAG: FG-GAP-like repeat-containing protein [Myxococcales bacterium]|nr:FG-GAP-like repeat-containing protein [Myxococcales bacterium]
MNHVLTRLTLGLGLYLTGFACKAAQPPRPPKNPPQLTPQHAQPSVVAGVTDGTFSVDGNGAANYVIPIEVPPGTNGVEPNLSLTYSSQRGNGVAGMGFGLSGVSAITRCPRTMAQDGVRGGVEFNGGDRFCLDGARLIATSDGLKSVDSDTPITVDFVNHLPYAVRPYWVNYQGEEVDRGYAASIEPGESWTVGTYKTHPWVFRSPHGNIVFAYTVGSGPTNRSVAIEQSFYGADGAVYHTERESWARVVSHGRCGSGPCSFTVISKKGIQQVYGTTDDSRIEAQGKSSVLIWALHRTTDLNGNYVQTEYDENQDDGNYLVKKVSYTGNEHTKIDAQRSVAFAYEGRTDSPTNFIAGSRQVRAKRLKSVQTFVGPHLVKSYNLAYSYSAAGGDSLLQSVQECDARNACLNATSFGWDGSAANPLSSTRWSGSWPSTGEKYYLGDFNGDGMTDILVVPLGGGYKFYISKGASDPFDKVTWSGSWPSTGEQYHLGDFNGDGVTDILVIPASSAGGGYKFYISSGASDPFATPTWTGSSPSTSEHYYLGDFNGDGMTDIWVVALHKDERNTYDFHLSNGVSDPFASANWSGSTPNEQQYRLGDFNGDGMTDILVNPGWEGYEFYISNGAADPLSSLTWSGRWPSFGERYQFGDFNGNGMTDILVIPLNGGYRFYTSNGVSDPFGKVMWAGSWPSTGEQYHLGDFNGDGVTDILVIPASSAGGGYKFYVNRSSPARLASVTNGVGGKTEVTYKPLTDPSVYIKGTSATYPLVDVQNAMHVVSRHEIGDGRPNSNDGSHRYTFNHTYEGALTDRNGRGWLGFRKVNLTDLGSGLTTTTIHNLDFPKTGGIQGTETRDTSTNSLLQATSNTYTSSNSRPLVYQVTRESETSSQHTGTAVDYALAKDYTYDAYGNVTMVTDHGDRAAGDPVVYTCTQYVNEASTSAWRLGYPTGVKSSGDQKSCQDFADWHRDTDVRWFQLAYDDARNLRVTRQYLYSASSGSGSWIVTTRTPDSYGNIVATTDPRGNTTLTTYDATYNTFPVSVTSPPPGGLAWEKCATQNGTCNLSGTRLVKYGAGSSWYYRLFPEGAVSCTDEVFGDPVVGVKSCYTSATDPTQSPALRRSARYEANFGEQLTSTGPNDNTLSRQIDGFGRVTAVYGPNPEGASVALKYFTYLNGPSTGRIMVGKSERTTWSNEALWYKERHHIDGLGRTFKIVVPNPEAKDGLVVTETQFDSAGRVWKEAVPHHVQTAAKYVQKTYSKRYLPRASTYPDGAAATFNYAFGQLGSNADRKVTRTIPSPAAPTNGSETVQHQEYLSSRGETMKRITADGGTTTHTYDLLGQVTTTTDPLGMVTTYTYDSLGRMLTVSMPSRGTMTLSYDPNGNLLTRLDEKGQRLVFTYDALNRPTRKTVLTSTQSTESVVTYSYDNPQQVNNKGRLSSTTKYNGSGTTRASEVVSSIFAYDAYGNTTTTTVSFGALLSPPIASFAFQATYHPTGEPDTYTYPDGSVLTRTYTLEGHVSAVSMREMGTSGLQPAKTYATFTDYNALGQAQSVAYGNGVRSDYTFNKTNGRRRTAKTYKGPSDAPTTTFLDYSYSWNAANKLLGVTDNLVPTHSQTFTHDSRGRLLTASGPYHAITYGYDLNGNIRSKSSGSVVDYRYSITKANQLTGVGPSNVTYDVNGNMLTRPVNSNGSGDTARQYVYDAENNLVAAYSDGSRASGSIAEQVVYDGENERIKKLVVVLPNTSQSTTWYVSPHYEVTQVNGKVIHTKYLYGPGGQLASVTTQASPGQIQAATHAMTSGMLLDDGLPLLCHRAWHLVQTFIAARPWQRTWIAHAAAVLPVLVYLLMIFMGSRRRRGWSRRGSGRVGPGAVFRKSAVVALGAAFLLTNGTRSALAELTPGANGAGVPVVGTSYFHQDEALSTTLVTDGAGNEVTRIAYQPQGSVNEGASSGTDQSRSKYSGKEFDEGVGLYYFGGRYYDPDLGRFLTPDPDWQFASPYVSDEDDPEDYYDPNGDFAFLIAVVVGAIIGAYSGAAAVNHDFNPAHWDWKSGKTWAGLAGGAVIGGLGGAAGASVAAAGLGTAGTLAAFGVLGGVESTAFTAMSGGSAEEIAKSFALGVVTGVLFAGAGQAVSRALKTSAGQAMKRSLNAGLRRVRTSATGGLRRIGRALGSGGCSSFAKGTPVLTKDGERPIESIAVGDEVWSYNEQTRQPETRTVDGLFSRIAAVVIVLTFGAATVEATPEHPFYMPAGERWVPAAALEIGDEILIWEGHLVTVTGREERMGDVRVFNLEVEGNHNYFLDDPAILTHNGGLCRLAAVGRTPSKFSRTGQKVFERSIGEGTARISKGARQVRVPINQKGAERWLPFDGDIHMGHIEDAVTWWNKVGYKFGPRSAQARQFMLNPDNYRFEYGPMNASNGAQLGQTYRRPFRWRGSWPP